MQRHSGTAYSPRQLEEHWKSGDYDVPRCFRHFVTVERGVLHDVTQVGDEAETTSSKVSGPFRMNIVKIFPFVVREGDLWRHAEGNSLLSSGECVSRMSQRYLANKYHSLSQQGTKNLSADCSEIAFGNRERRAITTRSRTAFRSSTPDRGQLPHENKATSRKPVVEQEYNELQQQWNTADFNTLTSSKAPPTFGVGHHMFPLAGGGEHHS